MPGKEKEQFLEYADVHRKKKKKREDKGCLEASANWHLIYMVR